MAIASVGLCSDCQHVRIVHSDRGAVFYRCQLAAIDPRFPKYPRLPVRECSGYRPIAEQSATENA